MPAPEVELFTSVLRGLASDLKKIASSVEIRPPQKSSRSQSGNYSVKSALSKSLSQISFLTESMSQTRLVQLPNKTGNPVLDRIKQSAHQELEICIDAYYSSENVSPLTEHYFSAHCEALIAVSPDLEAVDPSTGANALFFAAGSGSVELTQALLKRGFSANTRDKKLRTPLFWAVGRGHLEISSLLIANGAKYYVENSQGNSVLHLAAQLGRDDFLPCLLRGFESPDVPGRGGQTPLHIAVCRKFLGFAKILVKNGASVETQDARGFTALHFAVKNEDLEISSFLISCSEAVLGVKDREGLTPGDLAAKLAPGNTNLKDLLENPEPAKVVPPQLLFAGHEKMCMQFACKKSKDNFRGEIRDCSNLCVRQFFLKRGSESVEESKGMVTLWLPVTHLVKGRNFQVRLIGGLWSNAVTLVARRCAICPSVTISEYDDYCQLHLRKN